jgi:hypothetical protein
MERPNHNTTQGGYLRALRCARISVHSLEAIRVLRSVISGTIPKDTKKPRTSLLRAGY